MKESWIHRKMRYLKRDRLVRRLERSERDMHRPGNFITAAIICGVIIGASLVGLLWLTCDTLNQDAGATTTTSGRDFTDKHSI